MVPADYPAEKVLEMNPDGVFFSNGPVSGCLPPCPCPHTPKTAHQQWVNPGTRAAACTLMHGVPWDV